MLPLALAALFAVGSTVANNIAANKVASARNNALQAQRTRDRMKDEETQALQAQSEGRYDETPQQMDEKRVQIGDYLSSVGNATAAPALLPASTSTITVQEQGKQGGKATAFTKQQADAKANLRSFGDILGAANRGQAEDLAKIGMLNGFRRGDQGALGLELEAASQKGQQARFIGDLFKMGAQAAMMYGMSGGAPNPNAPFSQAAGTTTGRLPGPV